MAASAREFFEGLGSRIDPAKIAGEKVSYRFDIDGAGSWRVAIDDGAVAVTESTDDADCVFRMKENVFLRLLSREQNPATAFMTGKIKVDGDMSLALKLQKLFF